ncbi:MAG: choice-of-anchor L domain-containing protein [Flavobacteriales bacterium]
MVIGTSDIRGLDPKFTAFTGFVNVSPVVQDPNLLAVANSVPGLIGESFVINSINDVAVLEFDFVASSDTLSFDYIFGSSEYFFLKILYLTMSLASLFLVLE